jgi:Site-specific DNA methylase
MECKTLRAVEFFSGIGAFSEACRDSQIEVIAAFDQNGKANEVFAHNFSLRPQAKNLDTIAASDIPEAEIWWMSPPCTPYSRRGKQLDDQDARALCLLKLIELLAARLPAFLMLENVSGFVGSRVHEKLKCALDANGYTYSQVSLCSTELGVPMRRPRFFIAACRNGNLKPFVKGTADPQANLLRHYLTSDEESLLVPEEIVEKYWAVLNIVDPQEDNAKVICFTRGYNRCRKASGSLIKAKTEGRVRFVAPEEILSLLGFSSRFQMPSNISRDVAWRLVGNSVDVRAVRALIQTLPI